MEVTTEVFTTDSIDAFTYNYNGTSEATITYTNVTLTPLYFVEMLQKFKHFIIAEVILTAIILLISIVANLKLTLWRMNYRNQMLLQLSIARFLKRLVLLTNVVSSYYKRTFLINFLLLALQVYTDCVIIILVIFFIKHMYDSVIVVVVNLKKNDLYNVTLCSWLIPIILSICYTVITCYFEERITYLIMCCLIRWPLMLCGTGLYLFILCKVVSEKIRKYAISLTVITFFLCLIINLYLFSEDLLILWCPSKYTVVFLNYFILGLMLNSMILCFYIVLLMKTCKKELKIKSCIVNN